MSTVFTPDRSLIFVSGWVETGDEPDGYMPVAPMAARLKELRIVSNASPTGTFTVNGPTGAMGTYAASGSAYETIVVQAEDLASYDSSENAFQPHDRIHITWTGSIDWQVTVVWERVS